MEELKRNDKDKDKEGRNGRGEYGGGRTNSSIQRGIDSREKL